MKIYQNKYMSNKHVLANDGPFGNEKANIRLRKRFFIAALLTLTILNPVASFADVPTGSEDKAKIYYSRIAGEIGFSTPDDIFQTTLNDVATYLG
jgi:hypothetical protein